MRGSRGPGAAPGEGGRAGGGALRGRRASRVGPPKFLHANQGAPWVPLSEVPVWPRWSHTSPCYKQKKLLPHGCVSFSPPSQEKQQYNLLNARLASSCHRGNCTAQRGSERQLSWQSQVALFRASSQLHFLLLPKA